MSTVEPVIGHLLSQNRETILEGLHKIQKYVTVDDTFSEAFMQNNNAISALKSVLRKPECYVATMQAMCALLDSNWMENINRAVAKNAKFTKCICETEVGNALQGHNGEQTDCKGEGSRSLSDKSTNKQITFATPATFTKGSASNALCIRFIRDMCHGETFALMKKALSSISDDHVNDVIATLHFCTLATQFSAKLILTKFNNSIPLHLACFRSQLSYRQRRIRVARLQFVLQLIRSAPEKKSSAFSSSSSTSTVSKNAVANKFSLDTVVNSFGTNMITSYSTRKSASMTTTNEYDGVMNSTFAPNTSHHTNLITIHGVLTHLLEDAAVLLQESTEEEQNVCYSSSVLELIEQKLITSHVLSNVQKRNILLGQRHIIRLLVKALDFPAIADKAFSVLHSIIIHLHESPCDYSSTRLDVADEQHGGMPNYLLFFILRHLRPTASYRASRLMIAILRRAPDLIRPFFIRISGHLAEENHYHSSNSNNSNGSRHSPIAPLTARVATLNVLTRIALCPLPFHLLSRKVTLETLAAKSNTFYSMSARDVVDEICPIWLGEYIHKIINNSHNLLFLCFALQLTYATLQRARAVLQIVSEMESNQYYSQHQQTTFNIRKTNTDTKETERCVNMDAEFDMLLDNNNKSDNNNANGTHTETDAQVFISQVQSHLLNSLPRREEFWHRMTQQLHPMLLSHVQHLQRQEKEQEQHNNNNNKVKMYNGHSKSNQDENEAEEKDMFAWPRLEYVLQRMWLVMFEYSEIFQLRVSWLSAVPSFTPLLRASLDPILHALRSNHDLLSSWSANSIAALCTLLISSFNQNVSMVKMHHITMMNKTGTGGLTEWPLLLSLLLWAVRHRRISTNSDTNHELVKTASSNSLTVQDNDNKTSKNKNTLLSVHIEENALAWIAKVLQWCVHGVTVQFTCTFSEALLWMSVLNEHDLPCFLHVLNSLLQRSLSKAATRVAEEMMQSEYGVLVHAAESFVERTREKQNAEFAQSDETGSNKINEYKYTDVTAKQDNHKNLPRQLWTENLQNNLSHFTHTIGQVKAKWPMRDELTAAYLSECLCSSSCDTADHNNNVNDSHLNKMIIRPVVISTHRKVRRVVDKTNNTILATEHHDDKGGDDDCTISDDAVKDRKVSSIQSLLTLCRTKKSPFPSLSTIDRGDADGVNEEAPKEENITNTEIKWTALSTALENDLALCVENDTHANNLVTLMSTLEHIPACKWIGNKLLHWQLAARLLREQSYYQNHKNRKENHGNMAIKVILVELILSVLGKMAAELNTDHGAVAVSEAVALSVITREYAEHYNGQSENETINAGKDVVLIICLRILLSVDMSILLKAVSKSTMNSNSFHKDSKKGKEITENAVDQATRKELKHILSSLASHQLLFYSGTLSTVDRLRYASLLCIHYLQERVEMFIQKDVFSEDNQHVDSDDDVDEDVHSKVENESEDDNCINSSDSSDNEENKESTRAPFIKSSKESKSRVHVYTCATVPNAILQNRFSISGMFADTQVKQSQNDKNDNTNALIATNVEVEMLSYLLDTYTEVELMEMSLDWPARLDNNIVCYKSYNTTEQTVHTRNTNINDKDDYDDESMLLLRSIFPEYSSPIDFYMYNLQNKNKIDDITDVVCDDNDSNNNNNTLDPRYFIPLLHCVFTLPSDALESHSLSMKYVGARTLCLLLRCLSFTNASLRSMAVSCLSCSHAFPAGPYKIIITFAKMKMCALINKTQKEQASHTRTHKIKNISHTNNECKTHKVTEVIHVPRLAATFSTFLILCIKPLAFYAHPLHHHLMQFFIHTHHALATPIPFAHWLCAFPLGVITHELMSKQQEKWYKMHSSQITLSTNSTSTPNSQYQRFNNNNNNKRHQSYKYKERSGGVLQASAEAMAQELRQSAPLHILFIVSILQYGCVTNGDAALIIQEGCVQNICHLITLISSSEELRVSLVEVLHSLCNNSTSITFQLAMEGHLLIWVMSFLFQLTREFGAGNDAAHHSEITSSTESNNATISDNIGSTNSNNFSNSNNITMLGTSSRYGEALFTRSLELLLKLCQVLTRTKGKRHGIHYSLVQGSHAHGFMLAPSDTMDITLQQIFVQVKQLQQILNRVNVTAKHTIDLVEEILLLEQVYMSRQLISEDNNNKNEKQVTEHQHSPKREKSSTYKRDLHTRYHSQHNSVNKRTRSVSSNYKNRNINGKRDNDSVQKYNKSVSRQHMNKRHKV